VAPFDYPASRILRRHGPRGYADYRSYRPWLRDEFTFRCVYCLKREQWGLVSGDFDLDHFQAQAWSAGKDANHYDNLLYSCHTCNLRKGGNELPDPCSGLTADDVRVHPDGTLESRSDEAERIILFLGLNSEKYKQFRLIWIRNVQLAHAHDREHYLRLMSFPADLPDLSRERPPAGNSRPDGIDSSFLARRRCGELSESY
jgi:hypothetical protein